MRKLISLAMLTFILLFIAACGSVDRTKIIVAEYNDKQISLKEFEDEYVKNFESVEQAKTDSIETLKNHLDLYVNYKLKLEDAEKEGYFNNEPLMKEYEAYKYSVGKEYIANKLVDEPGLKKLYNDRKKEYRVRYIFIQADQDKTMDEAKTLAGKILDSLKSGIAWDVLFDRHNKILDLKESKGDIYYVTGGMINRNVEDFVYNTPKGTYYPEPVFLGGGWGVVNVTDVRDRVASVDVQHILLSPSDSLRYKSSDEAKKIADELYERLMKGENFDSLAIKYSTDNSAAEGGKIGFIKRRETVLPFDETAFSLKAGEISKPVKTQFGYHIIKVNNINQIPPFEEEVQNLTQMYNKYLKPENEEIFYKKLQEKYNYVRNDANLTSLRPKIDSLSYKTIAAVPDTIKSVKDTELFKINNKSYTFADIIEFIAASPEKHNVVFIGKNLDVATDDCAKMFIYNNKTDELMAENQEFRKIMDDYKKGLIVFKIQEDKVWNKVEISDKDKEDFYHKNKASFSWADRVSYIELSHYLKEKVQNIYDKIKAGAKIDTMNTMFYPAEPGKPMRKDVEKLNVTLNYVTEKANNLNVGEISEPFKNPSDLWTVVLTTEKIPAGPKTFDEAVPEIIGQLQDIKSKELDKKYIEELRTKFNLKINYEELNKAFK